VLTLTACANLRESTVPDSASNHDSEQTPLPTLPPDENNRDNGRETEILNMPFEGKIAIITFEGFATMRDFHEAQRLVEKYGEDKIVHRVWPPNFMQEGEMMIDIVAQLRDDPDIRAIVVSNAVINTKAAFARLWDTREDIFVVLCNPTIIDDDFAGIAEVADLIIATDYVSNGEAIVLQAIALGAEAFVYYSFPRNLGNPAYAARLDLMRTTAERSGLKFVEVTTPDPMGDNRDSISGFISEDMLKQVEQFGKNTAFFGTNCIMVSTIIATAIETGAIFPQPCHPSPFHGFGHSIDTVFRNSTGRHFDWGLDMITNPTDREMISIIREVLPEIGKSGRLSTWPMSESSAWLRVGVEYAIRWLNGEVSQERGVIDLDVLSQISTETMLNAIGEPIGAQFEVLEVGGYSYDHFVLGLWDHIVF